MNREEIALQVWINHNYITPKEAFEQADEFLAELQKQREERQKNLEPTIEMIKFVF